ncbi:hypothetical protein V493_04896 [Pseudogymnoascus sp. VKM F-4281 (FW-2241)]|nr:hypothetical protein V493_04896 [Pseudogymnoascus sp. VKM F-4281 (FW-2241)]
MRLDEQEPLLSKVRTGESESHLINAGLSYPLPSRAIDDDVLPETATYGRNLGWSGAYIVVISRVIGSGIFATPGSITKSVGSIGISLLLWVAGAVLAACGLAISLEYGCMLPRSGGEKVYLEFTYRHPRFLASTLVAVQAVLLGFTASNCIIFGRYAVYAFCGHDATDFAQKLVAASLMTVITVIHGSHVKTGIAIQNAIGWVKVFLVVSMGFAGLYVILFRPTDGERPEAERAAFGWDDLWEGSNWSWGIISTAVFKVSYSYSGLHNVNNVLNEVKDPVRTLKSVGPIALITACIFYLLVNIAYFAVIPLQEIKDSGELVAALFFDRLFGNSIGKTILPLAIAVSAAGNVMVTTFSAARVNQEIARQGFLPYASLFSSSRPFNTPLGGLIVHYIPSILVITLPPLGDVYAFILDVEGYPGQFFALATTIGLLKLRKSRPELLRPFKAWLPVVWLRIGVCLALIAAPFVPPKGGRGDVSFFYATYAIVGIMIILFAVGYWYVYFVAMPWWNGYRIEEETKVLEDGTSITKLVKAKNVELS